VPRKAGRARAYISVDDVRHTEEPRGRLHHLPADASQIQIRDSRTGPDRHFGPGRSCDAVARALPRSLSLSLSLSLPLSLARSRTRTLSSSRLWRSSWRGCSRSASEAPRQLAVAASATRYLQNNELLRGRTATVMATAITAIGAVFDEEELDELDELEEEEKQRRRWQQ
jgi:hypothetical protein